MGFSVQDDKMGLRLEDPMRVGGFQYRLLGMLAIGTICLLFAYGGGGHSGARKGVNLPSTPGLHDGAAAGGMETPASCPAVAIIHSDCVLPSPTSPLTVNIRSAIYGAKGDGVTDDTAAIQRAVDKVAGTGGTVLIPDGTYMVNAVVQNNTGINLKSNMTLRLSSNAVLQAIPNASGTYAILAVRFASNVNIVGGTLLGERSSHTGTDGEWGMGLSISNSNRVAVQGVTAKECWGDGFYITDHCTNVTLCNVTGDHNRRQGLSVTSVDGLVVRNSTFKNTAGTEPECGIDFEPNRGQVINNAIVIGCAVLNNAGSGIQCGFNESFTAPTAITNTVFDTNTSSGNGVNPVGGGYRQGILVSHSLGNVSVTNNVISGTHGQGIMVTNRSANTVIRGNTVTGTLMVNGNTPQTGGGIYIWASPSSSITHNTVTGNAGIGIWVMEPDPTLVISGNIVSDNGKTP
jgi:parallel beta-helix repeat protein